MSKWNCPTLSRGPELGHLHLHAVIKSECTLDLISDEENEGYNTIEEQEKVEKARKPKMKKGRGRNAKKKTRKSNANGDPEGDGYEVFQSHCFINVSKYYV